MDSERHDYVVLVGPTHPYTGGVAQHTTRLALELESLGIPVSVESWSAQYPSWLYPGAARVPEGRPEIGVPAHVTAKLAWYNPLSWWLAGRRSRGASVVALNIPTPFHSIPYRVFLAGSGRGPLYVGLVHNVLPHESSPVDRVLMKSLLGRLNRVIVHGNPAQQEALGLGLDPGKVMQLALPTPWPDTAPKTTPPLRPSSPRTRLLFFGTIRPYKGLDLLLRAMTKASNTELTIAGEFWEDETKYRKLITELELDERVTVRSGYVAEADFGDIFGDHDILVMPYRSGTGSIVRELAFRFGLPVIATQTGSIAEGVINDKNGLVLEPESLDELSSALERASDVATVSKWKSGVAAIAPSQHQIWNKYVDGVLRDSGISFPRTKRKRSSS